MNPETNTTEQEASTILAAIAKTMTPANPKPLSAADKLRPYRRPLLAQRKAGFSHAELVQMLATKPKPGIVVTESYLRKFLSVAKRRPGKTVSPPLAPAPVRAPAAPAVGTAGSVPAPKR